MGPNGPMLHCCRRLLLDTCRQPLTCFSMDFHAAASTCVRLCAPRPIAPPLELDVNPANATVFLDTGFDRFTLYDVVGDLEWLAAAHKLGGLLLKVLPTTSPSRLGLLASWENQTISLTGTPSC